MYFRLAQHLRKLRKLLVMFVYLDFFEMIFCRMRCLGF
jgi:hypothetical protein